MSAFLVGKAHIDALVDVTLYGPANARAAGGWHPWLGPEAHERDYQHSPDALGALLWLENAASIRTRYPDDARMVWVSANELQSYQYQRPARRLTVVEALKALSCYEYQSCEHDGWEQSTAHRVCEGLRGALITALPGYEDAAWEIAS